MNSSDNNVPVSMDAVIFGPAIYDPEILDSHDIQSYSFSRWSFLTSENVGGKLFVPGDGYIYYVGATRLFTSVATILVGEDPEELKHVTLTCSPWLFQNRKAAVHHCSPNGPHADYIQVLDDVIFEFGYNGEYTQMGVFTIYEHRRSWCLLDCISTTNRPIPVRMAKFILFTPHQSLLHCSQDKITTNPATLMDVVVPWFLWKGIEV